MQVLINIIDRESSLIVCQTSERGEIVRQVGMWDLFLQQVCFVEEEDEVGLLETGVGDNSPE